MFKGEQASTQKLFLPALAYIYLDYIYNNVLGLFELNQIKGFGKILYSYGWDSQFQHIPITISTPNKLLSLPYNKTYR